MVAIVKFAGSEDGEKFINAINLELKQSEEKPGMVAFDCEGVNLSRLGTLELISICFSNMDIYLVDFGGSTSTLNEHQRVLREHVKRLFESRNVIKIIHDCRMDSDALSHLHGINLTNVHDTSVFHTIITGQEDKNLNDVLQWNRMEINSSRDKNVYQRNPSFWATRPVSQTMIEWATSDADKLYALAKKQLELLKEAEKIEAMLRSEQYAVSCRNMTVATGLHVANPSRFIGPKGSNIRTLQRQTGTVMYQERPKTTWFVYYPNITALNTVKRKMSSGSSDYW